jgi:hypothetical protein
MNISTKLNIQISIPFHRLLRELRIVATQSTTPLKKELLTTGITWKSSGRDASSST